MILPNKQSNKSAHRTTTQSHGKMMCDAGKELNIWHTATATSTEYERERKIQQFPYYREWKSNWTRIASSDGNMDA